MTILITMVTMAPPFMNNVIHKQLLSHALTTLSVHCKLYDIVGDGTGEGGKGDHTLLTSIQIKHWLI